MESAVPYPMAVGLRGGGELAGKIGDGDKLLAPGLEIAQLDLAVGELVADDDGEVGVVAGRRFELLAELANCEVRSDSQAGGAQVGRDPEAFRGCGGVGPDDDGERNRLRRCGGVFDSERIRKSEPRSSISPVARRTFSVPGSRGVTSPATVTTNSLRTRLATAWASGSSALSTTTWVIPWRSRRSRKISWP